MQICCLWIFGKRRHSGDFGGESQLKTHILFVVLRHWWLREVLSAEKIK